MIGGSLDGNKSAAADETKHKGKPATLQLFPLYHEKTFCSALISSIFGTENVTIMKCFRDRQESRKEKISAVEAFSRGF